MSGSQAAGTAAAVLVLSADMMIIFSVFGLLPWRTTCAFAFFGSLVGTVASVVLGEWFVAGLMAMNMALTGFHWWKHRNDDDDDDVGRRRRRVTETMKSWLPKPKAFARPVPAQN
ncbi:hypothetical protein ACPCSE_29675 [Streptomyces cellulosae]